jgi:uncharacterized protein YaiE (UPF0345 family)
MSELMTTTYSMCQRRLREMESWVDRHAGERFWVQA